MSEMNLIITGSRGFIGMNFLLEMEKNGFFGGRYENIFLIDPDVLEGHNSVPYEKFLERNPKVKDFHFELGYDHIDGFLDLYENGWRSVDLKKMGQWDILNFASLSHVDESINNPCSIFESNTLLITGIVDLVGGVDNINIFHHIRTDEEYGHLEDVSQCFDDNSPINPRNPYSASKASQYLFLKSLETTFGMKLVCYVLANQFGPYQHKSKMIPATLKRILNDEPALVYGEGKEMREWTYVGDTVNEIYDYVNSIPMVDGSKFDKEGSILISNPEGLMSNKELVELLILRTGKGSIEYVENRKGHDFAYRIRPTISRLDNSQRLERGFNETIKHYEEKENV